MTRQQLDPLVAACWLWILINVAAWLWVITDIVACGRRLWAKAAWLAVMAGYWIRPYDVVADRRRWRWRPRAQCGSAVWAGLPDTVRAELLEALQRRRRQ